MSRIAPLVLLGLLSWPVLVAAQTPLPPAEFLYPHDCGVCDGTWPDRARPGMGSYTYPCTGRPNCPHWGEKAIGTTEGFAFGDGAPEVMARLHMIGVPLNTHASVTYFFEVVGTGTDPFGELDLVPLAMDYFISLSAFPQVQAKITGFARVNLLNITFFDSHDLLMRRVCSSTETSGTLACFGSNPHNPSTSEGGSLRFFVLGLNRYRMLVDVATHMQCLVAGSCHGFGGGYLDPLPRLDLGMDPVTYGRPPGFRLQDHYRIEFSSNHVEGPRQPGELLRTGFEAPATP